MKEWKIGLIGTGWWSDNHLQAWRRIPGGHIAALCDRNIEKCLQKANKYGVPHQSVYEDAKEMLKQADIDIVDIVTGPESHLELIKLAAEAGKHIMCQKPFAGSFDEAAQMVQIAKANQVRLMVTENWRWLEPFRILKSELDSGKLGRLHTARYIHTDYYTPRMGPGVALPQPFFREMRHLLFYEMGAHWFDTWRFLFGTPRRLFAETLRISPYIQGEDSGIVVLGYDDFYGFMDMSWATRQKLDQPLGQKVGPVHLEQLIIDGEGGTIKLYTSGKITFVSKDGSTEQQVVEHTKLDHEESHFLLQSHFIDSLNTGAPFQTSGEDNLMTLKMVFGTYESSNKHQPVWLDQQI